VAAKKAKQAEKREEPTAAIAALEAPRWPVAPLEATRRAVAPGAAAAGRTLKRPRALLQRRRHDVSRDVQVLAQILDALVRQEPLQRHTRNM